MKGIKVKELLWFIITWCVILNASIAQQSATQPILQLSSAPKNYVESYRIQTRGPQSPASSLRGLAGLHLGLGAGPFRLDQLQVRLPTSTQTKDYCARIATADGRYWSLNPYRRIDEKNVSSGIETRSRFHDLLAESYSSSDILVRLVATTLCNEDARGPLIPVALPGATKLGSIFAYVNAPGDRVTARLLGVDSNALANVKCKSDDSNAFLYTNYCELPLDTMIQKQATRLEIGLIGSSERPFAFDIQFSP